MIRGLHWLDLLILALYFGAVLYLGVVYGGRRTRTLGDFFVAGGKWGPWVSFLFIFASAIAGNEAVVVAKGGYQGGLSGVWYWWSFLFATPIYFVFSTYYRRARVYNLAEFLEMRYGSGVSCLYGFLAGVICILSIGTFLLAIGKILSGMVEFHADFDTNTRICIWLIAVLVGAYVFSGGMMSALITDLMQGLMCLFILGLVGLPFLWREAGGFEALRSLPASTWDMTSDGMRLSTVLALNLAALVGGIAAPWIFNWISVARDEKAATQCAWGHLWKRIITLGFAIYGVLFLLYNTNVLAVADPELSARLAADPELAWGVVMKRILPPVFLGLLIASFFAAAMSSADTYATTSSAMMVDFIYRKVLARDRSSAHYLLLARIWAVASILLAAGSTGFVSTIGQYVKLTFNLLCFLGIPIYFGVVWNRANRTGTWVSFLLGIGTYLGILMAYLVRDNLSLGEAIKASFEVAVFCSTGLALIGMYLGSRFGQAESTTLIQRFHVILNTPIGREQRLVEAGIRLPALLDAGLVPAGREELDPVKLEALYREDARDRLFSCPSIELRREPTLPWYGPGLVKVTAACLGLVVLTWLGTRLLFVWNR